MNVKQRINWIDIARGQGIILVILGHCLNMAQKPFQIIFVFHMPLFFILSGYLFREGHRAKEFGAKKTRTLIIPYVFYFLLGLGVSWLIPEWRESLTWEGIRSDLWLATPNTVHNSSIWFLVCLFLVQLIFWIVEKFHILIQVSLLSILYIVGTYAVQHKQIWGWNQRLPFNIEVVPAAIMFFAIGFYLKKLHIIEKMLKCRQFKLCWIICAGVLGVIIAYHFNGYVNMHALIYGNPILYLLGGMSGSISVIALGCLLDIMGGLWRTHIKKLFMYYGENSLEILGVQSIFIRLYIVLCKRYGIELNLYCFPSIHTVICFSVVTFVLCPIFCYALRIVKGCIKEIGLKKG